MVVPDGQTLTRMAFSGTSAVEKVLRSCGEGRRVSSPRELRNFPCLFGFQLGIENLF